MAGPERLRERSLPQHPLRACQTGGTILDEAVTIVSAVSESRTTPTDLIERIVRYEPSVFATGVAICFRSIALDWNRLIDQIGSQFLPATSDTRGGITSRECHGCGHGETHELAAGRVRRPPTNGGALRSLGAATSSFLAS